MRVTNSLLSMLVPGVLAGLSACVVLPEIEPQLRPVEIGHVTTSPEHARQLINQGKPAEAITAFRSLLRTDGPTVSVLNGLAVAHAELGRPDLAAGFFSRALSASPDDPATLNNIGYAALRRQEIGLARRYLEKAQHVADGTSDVSRHHPEIANNLGALRRLEARRSASTTGAHSSMRHPSVEAVALEKTAVSAIRLSKRHAHADIPRSRQVTRPDSKTSLIDFSDVFNPWSEIDPQIEPPL